MNALSAAYLQKSASLGAKALIAFNRFNASAFGRNLRAFGGAEIVNKLTRIAAMVVIARSISVEALGAAAIALTSFELIRIVTNNGIGQMIVRASDENLEAVSARAHQLNCLVCCIAGVLQITVGLALWRLTEMAALFYMGACLSIVFFCMPFGLVRIFRAMRRNRMDVVAKINFFQISADNLLALALALSGLGAWALVAPKFLTFPIWLVGARRSDDWRPCKAVALAPLSEFRKFCLPVCATEGLKGLRMHLDKALIAALLGVEALGVYFFAFNAGLGLAQTLSAAFAACLYPQLCNALREEKDVVAVWTGVTGLFLTLASGLFLFQIAAASFYVPLVFGGQWISAVPFVIILCLAASPRFLSDCASQLARVYELTLLEACMTFVSFAAAITAIAIGAMTQGLMGAAIGLTAAAWVIEPITAFLIRRKANLVRS